MLKGCKKFVKRKAINNFDAFFNTESIDCFTITYTVLEIILKNKKKIRKKWFYKKPCV